MADLFQKSGAIISECGMYRYRLWRVWNDLLPVMAWTLQNPSKADGQQNDPTVMKMIGFATRNGFGGIMVFNVFAYRATDERELFDVDDPIGPKNLESLREILNYPKIMVGWGNRLKPPAHWSRGGRFRQAYCDASSLLRICEPYCLGVNKSGDPKHPLFVPYSAAIVPWAMNEI